MLPGLADGLALVAPTLPGVATGYAVSYWLLGARSVSSWTVALVWLLAVGVAAAVPRSGSVPALAALATTVGVMVTGYYGAGTAAIFLPVAVWGLLAVFGAAAGRPARPTGLRRLAPLSLAAALAAITAFVDGVARHVSRTESAVSAPSWAAYALPLAVVAALGFGLASAVTRRDTRLLWGALVLLCGTAVTVAATPGPLSVPLSYRTVLGLGPVNIAAVPLLAALVVYLATAGRRPGQPAPAPQAFAWPALERAGGVCLAGRGHGGDHAGPPDRRRPRRHRDGHRGTRARRTGGAHRPLPAHRDAADRARRRAGRRRRARPRVIHSGPNLHRRAGRAAGGRPADPPGAGRRRPRRPRSDRRVVLGAAGLSFMVVLSYGVAWPIDVVENELFPVLVGLVLAVAGVVAVLVVLRHDATYPAAVAVFATALAWLTLLLVPRDETVYAATVTLGGTAMVLLAATARSGTWRADRTDETAGPTGGPEAAYEGPVSGSPEPSGLVRAVSAAPTSGRPSDRPLWTVRSTRSRPRARRRRW